MFIEKYADPDNIINLDYMISMERISEKEIKFKMMNGTEIIWEYHTINDLDNDINALSNTLRKKELLISAEFDEYEA